MALNIQQIKEADDLNTKVVHVDEWDGDVLLGQMSAHEFTEFWAESFELDGEVQDRQFMVKLLARALRNDDGSRMFPNPDDGVTVLGDKSLKVITQLAQVASELNAVGDQEVAEGKDD